MFHGFEQQELEYQTHNQRYKFVMEMAELSEQRLKFIINFNQKTNDVLSEFSENKIQLTSKDFKQFTDSNGKSLAPGVPGFQQNFLMLISKLISQILTELSSQSNFLQTYIGTRVPEFIEQHQKIRQSVLEKVKIKKNERKMSLQNLIKQKNTCESEYNNVLKIYEKLQKNKNSAKLKLITQLTNDLKLATNKYYSLTKNIMKMVDDFNNVNRSCINEMDSGIMEMTKLQESKVKWFQQFFIPIGAAFMSAAYNITEYSTKNLLKSFVVTKDLLNFTFEHGLARTNGLQMKTFVPFQFNFNDQQIVLPKPQKFPFCTPLPLFCCIANYDFNAESSSELSFKKGDYVCIFDSLMLNWSLGYVNDNKDKIGYVPTNLLSLGTKSFAFVSKPYFGNDENELTVSSGDIVLINEVLQDTNYVNCKNLKGKDGILPKDILIFLI